MFDEKTIQKLKQSFITVDTEKSKTRLTELWKTSDRKDKDAILTLSGVARPTVQRAYSTGNATAKIIIAFAQTFNVSPFYLTGESDATGACTDEILKELLKQYKYNKLLSDIAKEERKLHRQNKYQSQEIVDTQKEAVESQPECPQEDNSNVEMLSVTPSEISPETMDIITDLTEEDMILLMKAILLRSKTGGKNAEIANNLKLMLLGLI